MKVFIKIMNTTMLNKVFRESGSYVKIGGKGNGI